MHGSRENAHYTQLISDIKLCRFLRVYVLLYWCIVSATSKNIGLILCIRSSLNIFIREDLTIFFLYIQNPPLYRWSVFSPSCFDSDFTAHLELYFTAPGNIALSVAHLYVLPLIPVWIKSCPRITTIPKLRMFPIWCSIFSCMQRYMPTANHREDSVS